MSTGKKLEVIGHARRRVDGRAKVTGRLRYAGDALVKMWCRIGGA